MDDIIISSENKDSHLKDVEAVFSKLQEYGLKLRKNKCKFFLSSVEYLGYRIDADGIRPLEEKVAAIKDAPAPTNQSELRSYLGLLTFYSRFLKDLSTVAAPLNELLGKKPWHWSHKEQNAFQMTKNLLLNSDALIHYDPTKQLYLQCDASAYGVGVVLSHRIDNIDRPIAFASRSLSQAQKKFSQLEKEGLAIIFGFRKFKEYVFGHRFIIITDHLPLISLFSLSKPFPQHAAARIQRWILELTSYDYGIEYRRTNEHGNCDALSRLPLPKYVNDGEGEVHALFFNDIVDTAVTSKNIRFQSSRDKLLSEVIVYVMHSDWPVHISNAIQPYFQRRNELSTVQGCLLWGRRVIIPSSLRSRILDELHESHMGIVRTKSLARSYVWWPNIDRDIEDLCNRCAVCLSTRK